MQRDFQQTNARSATGKLTWAQLARGKWLDLAALISWAITLLVVIARALLLPHRALMLKVYEDGALHWLAGQPLYGGPPGGFLYGPLAAAFFAGLLAFPKMLQPIIWLLLDAAVFAAGVISILRVQFYRKLDGSYCGVVFLLLLPLVLGNFDMSQANPAIIGLIMLCLAAAWKRRWNLAAVCLAFAIAFKLYPMVIGLLLLLIYPRQLGWRLLLALLILGLVPFLFQHPHYVASQYRLWFTTLLADNRLSYDITMAPIDLWLLLVRLGGLNIPPSVYKLVQGLSGAGIALYCIIGRREDWPRRRLFVGLFSFACIWMTLFGPATEGLTYAVLAPAVVFAAVDALVEARPTWLRAMVLASLSLFLLTVMKNSLAPHLFGIWTRALQPIAALIFLGYCFCWLLDSRHWSPSSRLFGNA